VQNYREKLEKITYVDTFKQLMDKCEVYLAPPQDNLSFTTVDTETPNRSLLSNGQRWQGLKDTDAEEEAYFNGSDNEEENFSPATLKSTPNGASPLKPLVDYPEDEEDDIMDAENHEEESADRPQETIETESPPHTTSREPSPLPPERLSEKRRREEEDEDELVKLSTQPKRRSSVGSTSSTASTASQVLRRKKSISSGKDGPPKKISISIAVKSGNSQADTE
jgi:protein phosphatase-4 regulatory subunit 3